MKIEKADTENKLILMLSKYEDNEILLDFVNFEKEGLIGITYDTTDFLKFFEPNIDQDKMDNIIKEHVQEILESIFKNYVEDLKEERG